MELWIFNSIFFNIKEKYTCILGENYAKAQLNLIIPSSYTAHDLLLLLKTTDRHTDTFVKTVLSKSKDLMDNTKVIFHIKLIPSHL